MGITVIGRVLGMMKRSGIGNCCVRTVGKCAEERQQKQIEVFDDSE